MKYFLTLAMMVLPAYAMAAPNVKIEITAEKVVMVEEDGKKVEKRVVASEVLPGDVLVYTLAFKNVGDELARNIKVDNPIPKDTAYVVDSAYGPGSKITFSVDGGKTFNSPSLLRYEVEVKGEVQQRKASPEEYTGIRWTIEEVGVGKSGVASFRVRVK
ncbi:MAG TPA: DUF11 domain-containing protein [Mariprofundaceae bacterium]|nr:DUF11 domain-containing protein [Mariprofundaceae bacterium]